MGKWRTRLYKTDRARDFDHERDRQVRSRQVYETIDRQPFQWIVVVVAGIGFFLDGYTLFASNVALPMISYVYWNNEDSHDKLAWINIATLAGTMVGQIVFGVLADQKGRKRMYGVELLVLIAATFGVVMCSTGTHDSMSIYAWLIVWRFLVGVGVGGDYPLSAVITSEFAPTGQRARMMAAVFFMQPLGQVAGNLVTMIVVCITRQSLGSTDLVRAVDIMWRWVIGIGVFPGLLAVVFRFAIPETPRFMLEIQSDPLKAENDATELFGDIGDEETLVSPVSNELDDSMWKLDTKSAFIISRPSVSAAYNNYHFNGQNYNYHYDMEDRYYEDRSELTPSALETADWTHTNTPLPTLNSRWPLTRKDLYQFFIKEKNYKTILATSLAWLFLDVGFYGIGMSSPQFLAQTWGNLNIAGSRPPWQITDDPSVSVYDTFLSTSLHALVILNLGSVVGSALLILAINRLNRVALQRWGFLVLAALFVAMGLIFMLTPNNRHGPVAVTLYVLAQLFFNFGPNATTYILPAELFPTRYRATCHGVSAAMGKLGSILIQIISAYTQHTHPVSSTVPVPSNFPSALSTPSVNNDLAVRYGRVLLGFSATMLLGFVVSMWVPQVQERTPNQKNIKAQQQIRKVSVLKRTTRSVKAAATSLSARGLGSMTLEELSFGLSGVNSASHVARTSRSGWL